MLGAETLRGLYPVDTVLTVKKICAEVCKIVLVQVFFPFMSWDREGMRGIAAMS